MNRNVGDIALALMTEGAHGDKEQWVHILPVGKVHGRDGRGPYLVAQPEQIIAATRHYAGKTQLVIDYDHQADLAAKNGQPAPAAGWITGLQSRSDGIWGLVEWTERAAAHLQSREYRYLSPVFTHTRDGVVKRLLRAALTNTPNLELTALASVEDTMIDPTELRQILGLSEDADDKAIMDAIRELVTARQSAVPNPSQYVPIGEFERVTAEMNRLNQGVSQQSAEITVSKEITAGRLAPMLREWGVALCTSNKPAFDAFVEKTSGSMGKLFVATVSSTTPVRGSMAGKAITDEQLAVCNALGHRPEELIVSKGDN